MKTVNIRKCQLDMLGIIDRMGPEEHEYSMINSFINSIQGTADESRFKEFFQPVLSQDNLCGYAYQKPLGYAGDYLLIEMIYNNYVSADPKLCKWDRYYHAQEAAKAVLNRKTYFINTLETLLKRKKKRQLRC